MSSDDLTYLSRWKDNKSLVVIYIKGNRIEFHHDLHI